MKLETALSIEKALRDSRDYREFLGNAIQLKFSRGGQANFSEFSRRAGFASRSFINELLQGKKRLTARSLPKVEQALNLKGDMKLLFQSLVLLEEPDLRPSGMEIEELRRKVEAIRARIEKREINRHENPLAKSSSLFSTRHVFSVYAGLGTREHGASFEEICFRTGLGVDAVLSALQVLIEQKCVIRQDERFYVTDVHLDIEGLGENAGFRSIYKHALHDLEKIVDLKKNCPETLVFHSAFSVKRSDLPKLKARLSQVLAEFIADENIDHGDCVTKLTVGFYR